MMMVMLCWSLEVGGLSVRLLPMTLGGRLKGTLLSNHGSGSHS